MEKRENRMGMLESMQVSRGYRLVMWESKKEKWDCTMGRLEGTQVMQASNGVEKTGNHRKREGVKTWLRGHKVWQLLASMGGRECSCSRL
jgi:hypothetical protein